MLFYSKSRRTKHGLSLCLVLCLFVLSISLQAQDTAIIDPTPTDTVPVADPESLPTQAPATPTLPLTETMTPDATIEASPVMPIVTAEATIESSPILPTVTPESTAPVVMPDVPVTPAIETPAPLPLLYRAAFEGSDNPGLMPTTGWTEVQVSDGKALQASASAERIFYSASLSSGAVEARFMINAGEAQVIWGAYQASLSADGTVALTQLNDQAVVASGNVKLVPKCLDTTPS